MTSWEKFEEGKFLFNLLCTSLHSPQSLSGLPPKEAFYNDLTEQELSDKDYDFVQTVMDEFDLETLGDLHDQ